MSEQPIDATPEQPPVIDPKPIAGDPITSSAEPSPEAPVTAPTITTVTATPIERETLAKELKEFAESVGHDAYLVWEWLVKRV